MFCRRAVARLRDAGLVTHGAPVIFVHQGTAEQAQAFFTRMEVPHARNVSDPERRLYKALKLKRVGLSSLFDTRMFKAGKQAWSEGFRQGKTVGSAAQLQGLAIVSDGALVAVQRAEHAGEEVDHGAVASCSDGACAV